MDRWDEVCKDLRKLDDTQQTNIFWAVLGDLNYLNNDSTFELLKKEVEKRIKK